MAFKASSSQQQIQKKISMEENFILSVHSKKKGIFSEEDEQMIKSFKDFSKESESICQSSTKYFNAAEYDGMLSNQKFYIEFFFRGQKIFSGYEPYIELMGGKIYKKISPSITIVLVNQLTKSQYSNLRRRINKVFPEKTVPIVSNMWIEEIYRKKRKVQIEPFIVHEYDIKEQETEHEQIQRLQDIPGYFMKEVIESDIVDTMVKMSLKEELLKEEEGKKGKNKKAKVNRDKKKFNLYIDGLGDVHFEQSEENLYDCSAASRLGITLDENLQLREKYWNHFMPQQAPKKKPQKKRTSNVHNLGVFKKKGKRMSTNKDTLNTKDQQIVGIQNLGDEPKLEKSNKPTNPSNSIRDQSTSKFLKRMREKSERINIQEVIDNFANMGAQSKVQEENPQNAGYFSPLRQQKASHKRQKGSTSGLQDSSSTLTIENQYQSYNNGEINNRLFDWEGDENFDTNRQRENSSRTRDRFRRQAEKQDGMKQNICLDSQQLGIKERIISELQSFKQDIGYQQPGIRQILRQNQDLGQFCSIQTAHLNVICRRTRLIAYVNEHNRKLGLQPFKTHEKVPGSSSQLNASCPSCYTCHMIRFEKFCSILTKNPHLKLFIRGNDLLKYKSPETFLSDYRGNDSDICESLQELKKQIKSIYGSFQVWSKVFGQLFVQTSNQDSKSLQKYTAKEEQLRNQSFQKFSKLQIFYIADPEDSFDKVMTRLCYLPEDNILHYLFIKDLSKLNHRNLDSKSQNICSSQVNDDPQKRSWQYFLNRCIQAHIIDQQVTLKRSLIEGQKVAVLVSSQQRALICFVITRLGGTIVPADRYMMGLSTGSTVDIVVTNKRSFSKQFSNVQSNSQKSNLDSQGLSERQKQQKLRGNAADSQSQQFPQKQNGNGPREMEYWQLIDALVESSDQNSNTEY